MLVVGGTSGIGAAIGAAFAAQGASLTLTGATPGEVDAARADTGLAGVRVVLLDVHDGAAVAALIGGLGRLHVLVKCAGVLRLGAEHEPEVATAC